MFLRDHSGKTHVIDITEDSSVKEIREKIQVKVGVKPEEQVLIFAGKTLLDGDDT